VSLIAAILMTSVGYIRLVFIREFRLFSIDSELIDTFVQKVAEVI
jgi:hypothetical protein